MLRRAACVLATAAILLSCGAGSPAPKLPRQSDSLGQQCSAGTRRLLAALDKPLDVELVVSSGVPALAGVEREFERLAAAYSSLGAPKVRARIVRLTAGDPRAPEGGGPHAGFSLVYGTQKKLVPAIDATQTRALAYDLAIRVRETVLAEQRRRVRVGVVTGKDEIGLDEPLLIASERTVPTATSIIEAAFPHYDLMRVRLTPERLKKLRALIVTQPGSAYTRAELAMLDDYLLTGERAMVVATSATRFERPSALGRHRDPPLEHSASFGGLDRLLEGYGIRLHRDLVTDEASALELDLAVGDTAAVVRHPAVIMVESRDLLAAFATGERLALPFSSSLELVRGAQPADVELSVLLRASTAAQRTVVTPAQAAGAPPTAAPGAALAAVASGRLKSAFGARRAARESRVFVLGSAFSFSNPFVFPQSVDGARVEVQQALADAYARVHLTSMLVSIKNLLDWATLDPDLVACASERAR